MDKSGRGLLHYHYTSSRDFSVLVGFFILIVMVNILTVGSVINVVVTVPQYIYVLYLLSKKQLKNAILAHFSFFLLSFSLQSTLGMLDEKTTLLYNYGTIKLLGPLRASYAMNILLIMYCRSNKLKLNKTILYYKLFKTISIICFIACAIGLCGLAFHPYYSWEGFISIAVYMFAVISTMNILLCVADKAFVESVYYLTISIFFSTIIGSYLCYLLGVVSRYSAYDIIFTPDVVYLAPALLIGILSITQKKWLIISLVMYIPICMGVGGKSVFGLVFVGVCLAYIVLFDKEFDLNHKNNIKKIRILFFFIFIIITFVALPRISEETMVFYKFKTAESMFSGDLSEVSSSPYIRIASLINIFYEGINNLFVLILGNGYGGYFEDHFGLFDAVNLEEGAWQGEDLHTGRYHSGHDTMVTVPLYNGFLGLFLLLRICIQYIKRIPQNFLSSISFLWIVLVFYYDTVLAVGGAFTLLGAEFEITYLKNKK